MFGTLIRQKKRQPCLTELFPVQPYTQISLKLVPRQVLILGLALQFSDWFFGQDESPIPILELDAALVPRQVLILGLALPFSDWFFEQD